MNNYERSIQAIKDYDTILSAKKWNKIAQEYNFLSSKSLVFASGKQFTKLVKEVRKINVIARKN